MLGPAIALITPVVLGFLAGSLRLFREPDRAIDPLNAYALYIAFPALVCGGLASATLELPTTPGFWLVVPAVLAITVGAARIVLRSHAATITLMLAFGNVAYLGLPLVERTLGESALPTASLAVAIHVLLAMTIGTFLFYRWSGAAQAPLQRVLRQPLLWAPIVGLAARLLPESARPILDALLGPLGRSAGPVALFLLGLYLYAHKDEVRRVDAADLWHALFKLGVLPALTFGLVYALRARGWIEPMEARVLFLLSAMPAAITTFSMARDAGRGEERVSRAIVLTTVVSALTIPLALWLSRAL
jgi:predicted permease